MARNIVPPSDRPEERPGRRPGSRTESVHPAYDAGLDPETQVFLVYPGKQAHAGSGTPIGPRPGPYMHSLIPRPGRWRGRSRTMLAAFGGGAVALLILAVIGVALSATDPGVGSADGSALPAPGADPYTLEALSGSGRDMSVTFSGPNSRTTTSAVPSGWTAEILGRGDGRPLFTVSGGTNGAPPQDDTITCRVRHLGVVVREDTAAGSSPSVDCGGY